MWEDFDRVLPGLRQPYHQLINALRPYAEVLQGYNDVLGHMNVGEHTVRFDWMLQGFHSSN